MAEFRETKVRSKRVSKDGSAPKFNNAVGVCVCVCACVKERRDSEPGKVRVDNPSEKIDEGVDDEGEGAEEGAVLSGCTKTRRWESSLR